MQLQFESQIEICANENASSYDLNEYQHAISQASRKLSNASYRCVLSKKNNKHPEQKSSYSITQNENNSIERNGVKIKGFLCVPIFNDSKEVIGVIATANKMIDTPFTHLDIEMLQTLAVEIAQILQRFATKILLSNIDQQDTFVSMLDMYQPKYPSDTTNSTELNINNLKRSSAPIGLSKTSAAKTKMLTRSGSLNVQPNTDAEILTENENNSHSSTDEIPNSLRDVIEEDFKFDTIIETNDYKQNRASIERQQSAKSMSSLLGSPPATQWQRSISFDRRSSADQAKKSILVDDYHSFVVSHTTPLQQIITLNFDAFSHSIEQLQQLTMQAFVDLDFLSTMSINTKKLHNFIVDISNNYRDNPYHNFRHGFSVFSFSFSFLKQTQVHTKLDPIDSLAMLVAALAHDVDHPGNTNDWEINSQSDLALKHNDVSVLENHHCNVTFQLLRKKDNNFISQFDFEQRRLFRKRVIEAILSTDMTHHVELCQTLDQTDPSAFHIDTINTVDGKLVQKLLNIVTHSGDLSAQCMPYPLAIKWARLVCDEFTNQVKKETIMKLPIKSIMQGLEDEETFLKSQCGFFDFVLKPLWKSFSRFFPQCAQFYLTLLHNRQQLQLQLESLIKEKEKHKNQPKLSMDDAIPKSEIEKIKVASSQV